MKTLLLAGIAGVFAMAPASAYAAVDSVSDDTSNSLIDLSFASSAALANPASGAKTMPNRGNMRQMKNMGNMHHAKNMRRMKNVGSNHRMNSRSHGGSYVRQGRVGYGQGYRKPHRGFRLPQTYVQPSYFIGNFGYYGLSQPNVGYGWSRYYDDAVLTDRYGVVQDARYNLDWDRYNQGYQDGYRAGQATYDPAVFYDDDRVVSTPSAYNDARSTYQGDWQGAYQEDGSYQGDWQGTYRDAEGRIYEGEYSGTFIGDGGMTPHWGSGQAQNPPPRHHEPYPDNRGYDDPRSEELAYLERCKKSSGIGGVVVGGAIGALAGNRIAGRGNRLGGSLIGGGLGAVAGAAIDQGTDRCRKLLKQYGYDQQHDGRRYPAHPPVRYHHQQPPQSHPTYPSGWNGQYGQAYYYPQAQPMVTTIVIQSAPVTTTTTTTYVEEEVVYAKPAHKKRWKPAAKKTWKPAPKAAPLKGCQQARCMYD
ncbi:RcnB family protein [Parasphingorhabdus flavimaris]|uniref:RcnB family protein n=1 Tax=Parasphingorhabdus flavimaris TaxID=266812 RepID=UPI001FE60F30|nr:RcnB family protein [Parasphingorhabdus flavimaris]